MSYSAQPETNTNLDQFTTQVEVPSKSIDNRLFVGGLSIRTTEAQLAAYMNQFGKVTYLSIIKRKGVSKGYAFVEFLDAGVACRVVKLAHSLDNKSFSCCHKAKEQESQVKILEERNRKIYLMGLPVQINEQTMSEVYSQFGPIERVTINRYMNDKKKGTAFILFENEQSARLALTDENKKQIIRGRTVKAYECLTKNEIAEFTKKGKCSKSASSKQTSSAFQDTENQSSDILNTITQTTISKTNHESRTSVASGNTFQPSKSRAVERLNGLNRDYESCQASVTSRKLGISITGNPSKAPEYSSIFEAEILSTWNPKPCKSYFVLGKNPGNFKISKQRYDQVNESCECSECKHNNAARFGSLHSHSNLRFNVGLWYKLPTISLHSLNATIIFNC